MSRSSSAKDSVPRPARLRPVAALSLLLLGLSAGCAVAEQTFFAIRRGDEARFLPRPGAAGQILPAAGRFFAIERAAAHFAVTRAPAPAHGGAPTLIRLDRSFLGLPPAPATPAVTAPAHVWPVAAAQSRVSSAFGWRRDPFSGKPAFHDGLDIAAGAGTAVVATAPGVVKAIGEHARLGRYVMVAFADGSIATYGHLREVAVAGGEVVRRGQRLGSVGSSGRSTGPHLHYHLEVDGRRLDPLPLLGPARLAAR